MATRAPKPEAAGATADLQLVLDSAPALIHTSLPDGYLDFFNDSWLRYIGSPLEPDDVEGIVASWRAPPASGQPFLYEARVRRADGAYRWMMHHKIAVRDSHARIVKWYGSSIDIEDRKRAEERLRRNEMHLAEAERLRHTGSFGCILATLKQTGWVVSGPRGAAVRLGLNRSTLHFRMKKLGIVRSLNARLDGGGNEAVISPFEMA